MAFSSSNALSSTSLPRSRKKADSSHPSLIFHFSFLCLPPTPPPQQEKPPPFPSFCGQGLGNRNPKQLPARSKHVGSLFTSPALLLAPFHNELRKHRAIPKYYKHQTVLLLQTPSVKMMKQDRKISLLPLPFIYN